MSANDQSDSCKRAASAALEVVREECGGMDVEIIEAESGMLVEVPTELAERIEEEAGSPVTMDSFEAIISEVSFVRKWLGGVVASEDVNVDASNPDYASRVHTFAESLFDDGLGFGSDDLVGTRALQMIADAE